MKRFASASILALFSSALIALTAAPGCSGNNAGSGFGGQGNPNNPGQDGGGQQGPDDASGGMFDTGSLGTLNDSSGLLGDANCATATAQASRQPVYMLFVLDGSGSMGDDPGNMTSCIGTTRPCKWPAATGALNAIFQDFQTKADPNFGAGLIVFSDSMDPTCAGGFGCNGPYPSSVDIPIAFVDSTQEGKLAARIGGTPNDGTPTHAALSGGWSELEGFTPSGQLKPGGKKVLVIITDGVPTDNSNAQCISEAAQKFAEASPQGPITTFVIGTGQYPSSSLSDFDPTFLGQLAQSGGAAPTGCNPTANTGTAASSNLCYFEVDPTANVTPQQLTQQFEDAINTIRGQISSCTFALNIADGGVVDPGKVNVIFTPSNGSPMELTQDPMNGWTYDNPANPTSVILHGTACTNMKTDPMGKISIVLGCTTKLPK